MHTRERCYKTFVKNVAVSSINRQFIVSACPVLLTLSFMPATKSALWLFTMHFLVLFLLVLHHICVACAAWRQTLTVSSWHGVMGEHMQELSIFFLFFWYVSCGIRARFAGRHPSKPDTKCMKNIFCRKIWVCARNKNHAAVKQRHALQVSNKLRLVCVWVNITRCKGIHLPFRKHELRKKVPLILEVGALLRWS